MKYSAHTIKPSGHIELREEYDNGKFHRKVIAPNEDLDKYNDIIEADENFDKYRTQENVDVYEQKLSESDEF